MAYAGICDRKLLMFKRKLAINIQIFAVSKILRGSYCNFNAKSGAETDATKSILLWQPVTTSNSQELIALFIC